jgi:glucose-specific phosphotransferase system IIA component
MENIMLLSFKKPIEGTYLDITHAKDDVFSQKLLGPGFVVKPINPQIISPIYGKIKMIYPTHHAIAISNEEVDILIHVGLNETLRNPSYFKLHVSLHDEVKQGDLLLELLIKDLELKDQDLSTPIVFVQKKDFKILEANHDILTLDIKD